MIDWRQTSPVSPLAVSFLLTFASVRSTPTLCFPAKGCYRKWPKPPELSFRRKQESSALPFTNAGTSQDLGFPITNVGNDRLNIGHDRLNVGNDRLETDVPSFIPCRQLSSHFCLGASKSIPYASRPKVAIENGQNHLNCHSGESRNPGPCSSRTQEKAKTLDSR